MSCITYLCDLQACCPSQETYEKIPLNFSCDIDLTSPPYSSMVLVWTGNTNTPIDRRGIKNCYRIYTPPTSVPFDSNAWSVDNNFMFSGGNQCSTCAIVFPCGTDTTCKPCVGITTFPYNQNIIGQICQPSTCFNWNNPIQLLSQNNQVMVSSIALNIGNNFGDIDFTFSTGWRPNRFQIWWDYDGSLGGLAGMTKVCDSLFVGNGLRPGTGYGDRVKDYWRFSYPNALNTEKNEVYFNCYYDCIQNQNWISPTISNHPLYEETYCFQSGFTVNEIDNQGFLALRSYDRDDTWESAGNFPWGSVVPTYGSPGQIGVVPNYPGPSDPSSSSPIKLRFNKPIPTPNVVYIVSYRGFQDFYQNDAAYLLQVDGNCN
jgi:hypothetical protein